MKYGCVTCDNVEDSELYYGYSKNVILIMDYVYSEIKPRWMTDAEFYVLCALYRNGTSSLSKISDAGGLSPSIMTKVSVSLEGKGLVRRHVPEFNRRMSVLELTPHGMDIISDLYEKYRKVVRFSASDLTDEELDSLKEINQSIRKSVLDLN